MSELPAAAVKANEDTLSQALEATHISEQETKEAVQEKPEETNGEQDGEKKDELEEGEIDEDEEDEVDDGKPKTVFDSARKFNLKHPLYSQWTLYFDSPQSKNLQTTNSLSSAGIGGGWLDAIRKVVVFDSIEEFWGLYNSIVPPSTLPLKSNYYLFKDGIIPAWEDPKNKNGGKWSIQVPREKTKGSIDRMWLYTMLAAIGETFETEQDGSAPAKSDLVTGVIFSSRPNFYRINVWTREAPDLSLTEEDELMKRIMTIGRHFKVSVLGYELDQKLVTNSFQTEVTFESHKDSERKGNKNKLTV